jgi:hypothetical protein
VGGGGGGMYKAGYSRRRRWNRGGLRWCCCMLCCAVLCGPGPRLVHEVRRQVVNLEGGGHGVRADFFAQPCKQLHQRPCVQARIACGPGHMRRDQARIACGPGHMRQVAWRIWGPEVGRNSVADAALPGLRPIFSNRRAAAWASCCVARVVHGCVRGRTWAFEQAALALTPIEEQEPPELAS